MLKQMSLLVLICIFPMHSSFLSKVMNWLDLLAILPFYVGWFFTYYMDMTIESKLLQILKYLFRFNSDRNHSLKDPDKADIEAVSKFLRILKVMKVARFLRIFKLARHFQGIQVLGYTFKSKTEEFGILQLFLAIALFSTSTLIHTLEQKM